MTVLYFDIFTAYHGVLSDVDADQPILRVSYSTRACSDNLEIPRSKLLVHGDTPGMES